MRNLFIREKKFKNSKNKSYSAQISILNNSFNFVYTILNIKFKFLDDDHYFGLYLTLFGDLLDINIAWTRKTDHAGFKFNFTFLWLMIILETYDIRHWDYDNEKWEVYDKI